MWFRLTNALTLPFRMFFARLCPVAYARRIGVEIKGKVRIYGSSLNMFSSEPFLVTLGDNVFISLRAVFVCHDGSTLPFRKDHPKLEVAGPITVGSNVFIGMGALILPGVTIGDDCIIGANSVVTKDVPDGMIAAGNPARIIKASREWLAEKQETSLEIGHLYGQEKMREYKRIFGAPLAKNSDQP